MGHTIGDGLIAVASWARWWRYLYFKHRERSVAWKSFTRSALPRWTRAFRCRSCRSIRPRTPKPARPEATLIHGLAWTALGGGGMLALFLVGAEVNGKGIWPLPLPLLFLGLGLVLYYVLASERAR